MRQTEARNSGWRQSENALQKHPHASCFSCKFFGNIYIFAENTDCGYTLSGCKGYPQFIFDHK